MNVGQVSIKRLPVVPENCFEAQLLLTELAEQDLAYCQHSTECARYYRITSIEPATY